MKKMKEKILNLYLVLKRIYKSFPITTFIIVFLTIIYALDNINNDIINDTWMYNISTFSLVFANGTLLVESIELKRNTKAACYILSMIMAIAFTLCSNEGGFTNSILNHLFICYMISIFAGTIFLNYQKSSRQANNSLGEYLTSIFIKTLKATFIYSILSIGTLLITSVFIFLILDGTGFELEAALEILILGLFYIPSLIDALCQTEKVPKTHFYRFIIKYLLGTLLIIAFAIIYMYLLKIVFLGKIPSNQIFGITAFLFIVGLPIWTMVKSFDEGQVIDKINHYLPAFFIPFIGLQGYSMTIRILNYGVTEARYLGIMLIIFEISYIIIYFIQNKKQGNLILVFIILTIFSTIVPYVNMYAVSERSQYKHLKLIKKETYTKKEQEQIVGAYYYLKSHDKDMSILTESEIKKIKSFKTDQNDYWYDDYDEDEDDYINTTYLYASTKLNSINIEGYKKLYSIDKDEYDCEETIEDIFKNFEIDLENELLDDNISTQHSFNILDNILKYIEYNQKEILNEKFSTINQIQLDDEKSLILTSIKIDYDEDTRIISYYSLSGYLLEK